MLNYLEGNESILKKIDNTKVYIDNKELILNVYLISKRLILTKPVIIKDTMDAFHGIRSTQKEDIYKTFAKDKIEGIIYESDYNVISIKNKGNIIVLGPDLSYCYMEVM